LKPPGGRIRYSLSSNLTVIPRKHWACQRMFHEELMAIAPETTPIREHKNLEKTRHNNL
jgi:hypothetical protein